MKGRSESLVATVLALLTLLDIAVGLARPPVSGTGAGAVVRFGLTACAAVTLLLGPGFVVSRITGHLRGEWLGFSVLLGVALLAATGLLAWVLAARVTPQVTCALIGGATALAALGVAWWRRDDTYDAVDRRALAIVAMLFVVAAGRALYSVDPVGDIYRGTVSQTDDASRPDSRIPFHVVQLIANGVVPWTPLGEQNFRPYDFSSRGPLAGMAAAPVVLLSGVRPDMTPDFQPWAPFDHQGFMAYKLAMEAFAAFSLLVMYGLGRRLLGRSAALLALLLATLSPFIVHETFFTWPKLLAGILMLAAAHILLRLWAFRSGLLAGAGYLVHPLALVAVPTLLLLMLTRLWPPAGRTLMKVATSAVALGLGVLVWVVGWRLVNGASYTQQGFLNYLTGPAPLSHWVSFRIDSMVSTLVPLWSGITHAGKDIYYDSLAGKPVPWSIVVAINYSCALPMAVGISFSPLFLIGLWQAVRADPRTVAAIVIAPLLIFWIYWGASSTGLIREGLQPWFLSLLLFYAWIRPRLIARWPWWRGWERPLLMTRGIESLFVLVGPSILTNGMVIARRTDVVALPLMLLGLAALLLMTWQAAGGAAYWRTGAAGTSTVALGGRRIRRVRNP